MADLEMAIEKTETDLEGSQKDQARAEERREQACAQFADCEKVLAVTPKDVRAEYFPRLEAMRAEALGEATLTVESCDNRERDMREWMQARIDAEDHKIGRLREKIVKAMEAYPGRANLVPSASTRPALSPPTGHSWRGHKIH